MTDFKEKFRVHELLVSKVGGWNISIRPQQPTIGSLVLSLERTCPSLSQLTLQESIDLGNAFKEIEARLQKAFDAQKINYLALMMVDRQVHYHVIPRYADGVVIDGVKFGDKCWPKPHNLDPLDGIDDRVLGLVLDKLKAK